MNKKDKFITLRVPESMHQAMIRQAFNDNRTVANWLRLIIKKEVESNGDKV